MKNKEALVDCFTYMEEQAKSAPLPTMDDFIQDLRKAAFLRNEDPMKVYVNINQRLGEGASGTVYGIARNFTVGIKEQIRRLVSVLL